MNKPNKKETVWLLTMAWIWWVAYYNYPNVINSALVSVKDKIFETILTTWNFTKDIVWTIWKNTPISSDFIDIWLWLWSWAFLWYSLANAIEKDSKMLKVIWSLTWWFLWYWLSLTNPWAYIIWAATLWLWVKTSKAVWNKYKNKNKK